MHSNTHLYFCAASFFFFPKAKLVFPDSRGSTSYIFHSVIALGYSSMSLRMVLLFFSLFKNCYLAFAIVGMGSSLVGSPDVYLGCFQCLPLYSSLQCAFQ